MQKQKSQKSKPRVRNAHRDPRVAARPLTDRMRTEMEAAFDAAARSAEPYLEEAEAVSNVRRAVLGYGPPGDVQLADVLLALSILICAIDRDPTPEEREVFAMLDAVLGVPARAPVGAHHAPIAMDPRRVASLASHVPPIRLAA